MLGKKAKSILSILTLAILVGSASTAMASWWKQTPAEKAEKLVAHVTDELKLTEDQQGKLTALSKEVLAQTKTFREQRAGHMDLLIDQVKSGQINKGLIKEELAQKHQQFGQVADLVIDRLADLYETLSPEQRTLLVERLEKHKEKAGKGHRGHGWWH